MQLRLKTFPWCCQTSKHRNKHLKLKKRYPYYSPVILNMIWSKTDAEDKSKESRNVQAKSFSTKLCPWKQLLEIKSLNFYIFVDLPGVFFLAAWKINTLNTVFVFGNFYKNIFSGWSMQVIDVAVQKQISQEENISLFIHLYMCVCAWRRVLNEHEEYKDDRGD